MQDDIVVGLDVGTTKICVVAGSETKRGINVLSVGFSESRGLKKGIVVDVEEATRSVVMALKEAEGKNKQITLSPIYVGIAGGHIKSFNGYGVIGIGDQGITEGDLERLIDMASVAYVPIDREVLQVIPSGFSIDGIKGIRNPLRKKGRRLEVRVHIVTGAITPVQNLIKCCEAAGLRVADIFLEPIASAEAVLYAEEKDTGTLLIDLGGGTTDIAVFREGELRHTASFAIGGNHITNDIATGLDLTFIEAERVKKAHGLMGVLQGNAREDKDKRLSSLLQKIVYLRCEELFSLIKKEIITFSGYRNRQQIPPYIKRVVLTGGTSLLKGIDSVAEKVLGRQVRIGIPEGVTGGNLKNPIYSTGLGLVRLGLKRGFKASDVSPISHMKVFERMKEWVSQWRKKL